MRGLGSNKALGLAIGERGITACELSRAGGAVRATVAEFAYPAGAFPDDPAALGKALREFLKSKHITARRAVIGLPLKWAVVKPKEVPPSSPAALANMLRLQAERDFAMEPQDLAIEYVGEPGASAVSTVLLVAVPRKRMDAVLAMAEGAGLSADAVTLSAVALAEASGKLNNGDGAVLHVGSGSAELAVQHRGQPRALRHLRAPVGASSGPAASAGAGGAAAGPEDPAAVPPAAAATAFAPRDPGAALTLELRQVLSLMPQNGTAGDLVLWDGVGLGDAPRDWADSLGVSVSERSLDSLGVTAAANGTTAGTAGGAAGLYAPAAALGLLALDGRRVIPDLLASRLVERKKSRVAKPLAWGIAVGCAAVFGIVFAAYDLSRQRTDVEKLKAKLVELQPQLKTAEATIARVSFAKRWQDQDPKFLACLRDLTAVFPDDAQIWATRLTLTDDGKGSLDGQAVNPDVAKAVLRRLQNDPHFKEVKPVTAGEAGRNSKDQSFSVTFRFTAPPPPVPAAANSKIATPATGPSTAPSTAPSPAPFTGPAAAMNTDGSAAFNTATPDTRTSASPDRDRGNGRRNRRRGQ